MPTIEPAVRQLLYLVPNGTSYIDLAKDLSRVNRRLYRQGMSYVVQDIQIGTSVGMKASDVYTISFSTAGNSWVVHNAWKKAFSAWRAQQNAVKKALGDIEGKWADFKIYLDDSMRGGTTLEPYAGDAAIYQAGEWVYSQYVWDDAEVERETFGHLIGSSVGTTDFGLIEEYGDSRRSVSDADPTTPADASTSMYAKLMNMGTEDVSIDLIDNIENANDSPPYDFDDYPGGAANADAAVLQRVMSCSGAQTTVTSPGFVSECGLIKVFTSEYALDTNGFLADASTANGVYAAGTAATTVVLITVAAGPYRGVLAAPMGQ
jgi:hypothetical protein